MNVDPLRHVDGLARHLRGLAELLLKRLSVGDEHHLEPP